MDQEIRHLEELARSGSLQAFNRSWALRSRVKPPRYTGAEMRWWLRRGREKVWLYAFDQHCQLTWSVLRPRSDLSVFVRLMRANLPPPSSEDLDTLSEPRLPPGYRQRYHRIRGPEVFVEVLDEISEIPLANGSTIELKTASSPGDHLAQQLVYARQILAVPVPTERQVLAAPVPTKKNRKPWESRRGQWHPSRVRRGRR